MVGTHGDRRPSSRGIRRVGAALGVIVLVALAVRALARRPVVPSAPALADAGPVPVPLPTAAPPPARRDLLADSAIWAVVRAPLRPFGLVERQGLIEAAQWRGADEPPRRGGRVRLTGGADDGLWLAWPAEAAEDADAVEDART